MSIDLKEDDGFEVQRTKPRSIRFSDLPRQSLDAGRGSVREVWADVDTDLKLRWLLRVVEIKDSTGRLVGPAGTHHFVVGLAGPQVAVRTAEARRVLRRDHVLPVMSSTLLFERPKLRPPGASSLLVLTFVGAVDQPGFVIRTVEGGAELPAGVQVLVALRGTLRVDGAEAAQGQALILNPALRYLLSESIAQLLIVRSAGTEDDQPG